MSAQLPPVRRKGRDPYLLVFAFIFPDDEIKFHPAYTRGESREELRKKFEEPPDDESSESSDDYADESSEEESSDESSEEASEGRGASSELSRGAPRPPRVKVRSLDPFANIPDNPRMFSTMFLLEDTARKFWKKSRWGGVFIPKSGGDISRSVDLANNSSLEVREIPPPEIIEKLKEALNTTRDPKWYRAADDDLK